MQYRTIKRCNDLKVSEIALGCEGLAGKSTEELKAMIDRALELGINFVDMCLPNPDLRDNLGMAIAGRRDKICLQGHIGAVWQDRDYSSILSQAEKFHLKGNCMYCGHCAPCTAEIDVASVNKYLNLVLAQKEVPETVADHYKLLAHHASECIACGSCERNCLFGVGVIEKMKKAAEIFGY